MSTGDCLTDICLYRKTVQYILQILQTHFKWKGWTKKEADIAMDLSRWAQSDTNQAVSAWNSQ